MTDLFALSDDIIQNGNDEFRPFGRINHELSELSEGIAFVEAFSNVIVFDTGDGLIAFDTSNKRGGGRVVEAIRSWRGSVNFTELVYTHGHVDHVGGSGAFVADANESGAQAPRVIGHMNVASRFDRYNLTNGYNMVINHRQFGVPLEGTFLPEDAARPTETFDQSLSWTRGDLTFDLYHARGETDDHAWAWIPERKTICAGDFFIWNFPNAGNPQKVQRYPLEWAAAMRAMAAREPEIFLPAHGLPIRGVQQIQDVLSDVATVLEDLVRDTLAMMNAGARLNEIIHTVKVDDALLARPYLRPLYDEPEFVISNIWRMYGGWYNGNPATLKPARDDVLARELADLGGGAMNLATRALALADQGDFRLACHLVETAVSADPASRQLHGMRADIYKRRADRELSLMARGIFAHAARDSEGQS